MRRRTRSPRVTSKGWSRRPDPISPVALAGFALGLLALAALVLAALGTRWDWWHFRTGFTVLRWAAYGGALAVLVSAVGVFHARPSMPRRGITLALIGLALGVAAFAIPWQWQRTARGVPPIHDITTDPQNPPQFSAVVPLRAGATNPPEYAGPETAAQQREAYPDIRPLRTTSPPVVVFQRALTTAQQLRWEIVAADEETGIIEATDRTFWFGFADDVVIRITPTDDDGSRVDVRSKSRVGRSDVGANARRIRRFMERLQLQVQ